MLNVPSDDAGTGTKVVGTITWLKLLGGLIVNGTAPEKIGVAEGFGENAVRVSTPAAAVVPLRVPSMLTDNGVALVRPVPVIAKFAAIPLHGVVWEHVTVLDVILAIFPARV